MSFGTAASIILLYPLLLLGDGCLLIAIAVASTTRGHALLWGASFTLFHALYGVLGVAIVSEASHYSEILGEIFMFVGAVFLLWHFVHHRIHHRVHDDCSCENHPPAVVSPLAIVSSAAALSLHSLAGGAIIQSWIPEASGSQTMWLLVGASCVVGAATSAIVMVGERQQQSILRLLDRLPGIVGFLLSSLCFAVVFHLTRDFIVSSSLLMGAFVVFAIAVSAYVGYIVHGKGQPKKLVTIGSRRE